MKPEILATRHFLPLLRTLCSAISDSASAWSCIRRQGDGSHFINTFRRALQKAATYSLQPLHERPTRGVHEADVPRVDTADSRHVRLLCAYGLTHGTRARLSRAHARARAPTRQRTPPRADADVSTISSTRRSAASSSWSHLQDGRCGTLSVTVSRTNPAKDS